MKTITVKNVKTQANSANSTARLVFTIQTESGEHDLWFQVSEQWARYFTDDRCDPAVVALVRFAIRLGYGKIVSEWPISRELAYNLQYHVIPQLRLAKGSAGQSLDLEMPIEDSVFQGRGVGSGMSLGVDSFATLSEYSKSSPLEEYRITHFTYFNVGAHHGQDATLGNSKLTSRQLYEGQLAKAHQFSAENSYDLVVVDSNLSAFLRAAFGRSYFSYSHTYRNVAAAMSLQKLFSKYYYSSAYNLDNFSFSLTYDAASYEKWLLPYLGTGSMRFYNSNQSWNRLEKTELVAKMPESFRYLTVCLLGIENCGKCDKCRKTLMALDVLGETVLDGYAEAFDLDEYKEISRGEWFGDLETLMNRKGLYGVDMQDIHHYATKSKFPHLPI
ncbi:hypothetical protein [Glutamicibacter sp. BW80]|uniref:hypothetical protein n=1 Tax=Glutamicibacter sp. BW80 TaxID=2024404 RepID=UPI0011417944|nr:hypothetical protein [Glutamicibacter sp. BW80]